MSYSCFIVIAVYVHILFHDDDLMVHACLQGQESDSSETSVRGPRIKHVCRRAAVALGRNRAVFPDDMPTLSALPWEEREKILSSMGNDGKASATYLSFSCFCTNVLLLIKLTVGIII